MGIQTILANFNDYLDYNTSLSKASKSKYYRIIRMYLKDIEIKYQGQIIIKLSDMNKFITNKTEGNKRGANSKAALKHYCVSIGKKAWGTELKPLKHKKRKKEFPYFTPGKMNRIINSLPMPHKAVAYIQAHSGARFREALTLKIEDIEMNRPEDLIFLKVQYWAKGEKKRTMRMTKKHEWFLTKIIGNRNYGFLFLHDKFNGASDEMIEKEIVNFLDSYNTKLREIGKQLDINGLSSHYVRHHFADRFMLQPGADIYKLKEILGHAKVETTKEYVSVGDKITNDYLLRDDVDL